MSVNKIVWGFVHKPNALIKLWLVHSIAQIFPVTKISFHLNTLWNSIEEVWKISWNPVESPQLLDLAETKRNDVGPFGHESFALGWVADSEAICMLIE